MQLSQKTKEFSFYFLMILVLFPVISSPLGLLLGLGFALFIGNPIPEKTKKWTPRLLQISVVGLGADMNLYTVAKAGVDGFGYTVVGISLTLVLGMLLARALKTEKETSILISVGTAICGGSAIAAVAPTIRAKSENVSVALACVFLLNSLALLLFPFIGHFLNLSQTQFGLWSALAIHDTSSVVGASSEFGKEALQIATTVKLARALWIVPLTLIVGRIVGQKAQGKKPWFILGFLFLAFLGTSFPERHAIFAEVAFLSRRTLVLTLFLIGSALSKTAIKNVGIKPFLLAIGLWMIVSVATLGWLLSQVA